MSHDLSNIPERINPHINMQQTNEEIVFFSGDFELRNDKNTVKISGEISQTWNSGVTIVFKGKVDYFIVEILGIWLIYIDGVNAGEGHISQISDNYMIGVVSSLQLGRPEETIDTVKFSLLNGSYIFGDPVKHENGLSRDRLMFKNEAYEITIDNRRDLSQITKELKTFGGYCITHYGEIRKHSGEIMLREATETAVVFSVFLCFVIGKRTNALFFNGCKSETVINQKYNSTHIPPYSYATSWLPDYNHEGLNELWVNFYDKWNESDDNRDILNTAIHWYIEANNNSGALEGAYIMAFSGLELMYNVLIGKKMKHGKEKIDKLSLYLNLANIDGEKLCDVRNLIVHYGKNNRQEYSKLENDFKFDSLESCLLLLELSILKYLDYKGNFKDRTDGKLWVGESCQPVPWINKN